MTIEKAIAELNELKEKHGENADIALIYFCDDDIQMICEEENINPRIIEPHISTMFANLERGLAGEAIAVLSDLITEFAGDGD